jgi:hypothetical protein
MREAVRPMTFNGGSMRLGLIVVLCSLFLQGASLGAAFHCRSPLDHGVSSAVTPDCSEGESAPRNERERVFLYHCQSCGAHLQGFALLAPPKVGGVLAPQPDQAASAAPSGAFIVMRPIGWASAWSSRAPPPFS